MFETYRVQKEEGEEACICLVEIQKKKKFFLVDVLIFYFFSSHSALPPTRANYMHYFRNCLSQSEREVRTLSSHVSAHGKNVTCRGEHASH